MVCEGSCEPKSSTAQPSESPRLGAEAVDPMSAQPAAARRLEEVSEVVVGHLPLAVVGEARTDHSLLVRFAQATFEGQDVADRDVGKPVVGRLKGDCSATEVNRQIVDCCRRQRLHSLG